MDKEINIKSTTLEKGVEVAKQFIDKLIMPSIEETGLLMKDHITMWRFKNQVKILNQAKKYCEKHNIQLKKISLKVLSPLLEYSSLEEEEVMQDKWSILLSNLIDSEQNIENHVFPYILSQLSSDEFLPLEKVYDNCVSRRLNLILEFEKTIKANKEKMEKIQQKLTLLEKEIDERKQLLGESWNRNNEFWELVGRRKIPERALLRVICEEHRIQESIESPEVISKSLFKNFEISNLIRLGLIKEVKEFYAYIQNTTIEPPLKKDDDTCCASIDIGMTSTTEFILTELGEFFFKSCKEKQIN